MLKIMDKKILTILHIKNLSMHIRNIISIPFNRNYSITFSGNENIFKNRLLNKLQHKREELWPFAYTCTCIEDSCGK